MPYKIKTVAKKAVLEPEEIVIRSQALLEIFYTHRLWVGVGGGLVLAVGLAWGGIAWVQIKQDRQAQLLEYEATREIAGTPLTDENQARHQKAAELYQKILSDYPRSSSAPFAQYQLGNIYFDQKRYDQAITAYQDFINRYASRADLLPAAYLRLGYSHLLQGDSQAALADFGQVISHPKAWNKDQAYYETGRVHEKLGDKTAAIGKYEGLIKEFPKSPWAREAQTRLRALGAFQPPVSPAGENIPPVPVAPEKGGKK